MDQTGTSSSSVVEQSWGETESVNAVKPQVLFCVLVTSTHSHSLSLTLYLSLSPSHTHTHTNTLFLSSERTSEFKEKKSRWTSQDMSWYSGFVFVLVKIWKTDPIPKHVALPDLESSRTAVTNLLLLTYSQTEK